MFYHKNALYFSNANLDIKSRVEGTLILTLLPMQVVKGARRIGIALSVHAISLSPPLSLPPSLPPHTYSVFVVD